MIDSNNIEIIRDNLKELDQRINSLDVEIPAHTSGDAGKYLGVDSSGDLEFSRPIPATTGADEGKVLAVNSSGVPVFITPLPGNLDYSATEQDMGIKWIDGKNVYRKSFTYTTGENSAVNVGTIENVDSVIQMESNIYANNGLFYDRNEVNGLTLTLNKSNGALIAGAPVSANFQNCTGVAWLLYTKISTTSETETLTKKKKSK